MTKRYPSKLLTVSKGNNYRRGFYDAIRTVIMVLDDRDKGKYAELLRGLVTKGDYKYEQSL